MPVKMSGDGGLEFHVGIDGTDFDAQSIKYENRLKEMADAAIEQTRRQMASFRDSAAALGANVDQAERYADIMGRMSGAGGNLVDPATLVKAVDYMGSLNQETQEALAQILLLNQELEEIAKSQAALKAELAAGGITTEEFAASNLALAVAQKRVNEEMENYTRIVNKAVQADDDQLGFLEKKRQELIEIKKRFESLSEEDVKSDVGKKLQDQFKAVADEIKGLTVDDLTRSGEKAVSVFAQLQRLKDQIAKTDPNDPQMVNLLNQAALLRERIDDAGKSIKLLSSSTAGLEAGVSGIRGLIGGFTAIRGVIGLFNDDASKMEKTIANVTSAMAFLNGVQEVAAVLNKNSALNIFLLNQMKKVNLATTVQQTAATAALAGAELAQTGATVAATTATKGLNAAMRANPALLLLSLIGALIAAYSYFSNQAEDAYKHQTKLNEAIKEANQVFFELLETQTQLQREKITDAQQAVSLAEAQGKSEAEIFNLKRKAIVEEKNLLQTKLVASKLSGEDIAGLRQRLELRQQELKKMVEMQAKGKKLTDTQEAMVEALKAQIGAIKSLLDPVDEIIKSIAAKTAEIANLNAEAARRAREAALKSQLATAEARKISAAEGTEEELIANKAYLIRKAEQEKQAVDITSGEILKINSQLREDLEALDRDYAKKKLQVDLDINQSLINQFEGDTYDLLQLQIRRQELLKQQELVGLKNTLADKAKALKIVSQYDRAIQDLSNNFLINSAKEDLSIKREQLENQLEVVKEGTYEELRLRQQLSATKAQIDIQDATRIENEFNRKKAIQNIETRAMIEYYQLQNKFADQLYEKKIKNSEIKERVSNIGPTNVLNNPSSSTRERREASTLLLQNEQKKVLRNLLITESQLALGVGNTNKLVEARGNLYLQLLEIINKISNKERSDSEDIFLEKISKVQEILGGFAKVGNAIQLVDEQVGKLILTVTDLGGAALDGIAKFKELTKVQKQNKEAKAAGKKQDILGEIGAAFGVAGAVASAVQTVVGIFKAAAEKRREAKRKEAEFLLQVYKGEQQINVLYRERALQQVLINKLRIQGLKDEATLLKQQVSQIDKQFADVLAQIMKETFKPTAQDLVGLTPEQLRRYYLGAGSGLSLEGKTFEQLEALFNKGQLNDKAKELFQILQKLKEEGANVNDLIEKNKKSTQELFTGTTEDALLDGIANGFKSGLRSAKDFATTFEDLMKSAVLNALKYEVLQGPLKEFYAQFAIDAQSGGVLTEDEVRILRERFNLIIETAGKRFEELKKITNINFGSGSTNSLSGAIKGITEEQADLLAGQFGGLRITAIEQLLVSRQSLTTLNNIETNTSLTVSKVGQLVERVNYFFGVEGIKIK